MDIGELARQSGAAPSALRFYEEKGLIRSSGRHGLRRQYEPEVLDQVALITLGRSAGLTLDEIGQMLTVGGRAKVDRQLLTDRADAIDDQIRQADHHPRGTASRGRLPGARSSGLPEVPSVDGARGAEGGRHAEACGAIATAAATPRWRPAPAHPVVAWKETPPTVG